MLRHRLRRAAGRPARALLDQRVLWIDSLVADRLGRAPVTVHDRFEKADHRLDDLDRLARAQLAGLGFLELERSGASGGPPADAAPRPGRTLAALSAPVAAALNWAEGPEGYAAQAGLWFNPPVPVEHRAGDVGVLLVNERIVEQSWVFAQVGTVARRILDVGGSESTVALGLATIGHEVVVVDPRGYPVEHPNLEVCAERLEDHTPERPYDVAVALSAVEHFGLGHYAGGEGAADDRAAVGGLRELVVPGGRLLLTVPSPRRRASTRSSASTTCPVSTHCSPAGGRTNAARPGGRSAPAGSSAPVRSRGVSGASPSSPPAPRRSAPARRGDLDRGRDLLPGRVAGLAP